MVLIQAATAYQIKFNIDFTDAKIRHKSWESASLLNWKLIGIGTIAAISFKWEKRSSRN
jgi:hypothetical protein